MLTKFFIFAVVILGIATRPSFGITAHEAMEAAYNATIGGAVSLKFTLWRAANCPTEATITRAITGTTSTALTAADAARVCRVCVCDGVTTTAGPNCNDEPCFLVAPGVPADLQTAWAAATALNTLTLWTNIASSTAFQLYRVDDGICYATAIDPASGRTMKCFAHRQL